MLEVFDKINGKNEERTIAIMEEELGKNHELLAFLKLYINDENNIITPVKILKMMRYFKVEDSDNMDEIEEIGDFASKRTMILKIRKFKKDKRKAVKMKNAKFLSDVYRKLQVEVLHKNQYKILKQCFLLLSNNDVKWFTRILCKKVEITKPIRWAIEKEGKK